MWKPKFIYESLPYIYALVALFAIFMPVTLGRVSGFLLLIAALERKNLIAARKLKIQGVNDGN